MKTNRESGGVMNINEWLAINVMGLSIIDEQICEILPESRPPGLLVTTPTYNWHPDTDIGQALVCAEKLRSMNLEEKFIESLILCLDLNVSLFSSALEGCGHTGDDVPKAIFAMIIAPPLAICEAVKKAFENNADQ